jgi:hypothetical protein
MLDIKDRMPLLIQAIHAAANTGRLSDQDWQALDRRLQMAVFETVAGRPPPAHGVQRDIDYTKINRKVSRA